MTAKNKHQRQFRTKGSLWLPKLFGKTYPAFGGLRSFILNLLFVLMGGKRKDTEMARRKTPKKFVLYLVQPVIDEVGLQDDEKCFFTCGKDAMTYARYLTKDRKYRSAQIIRECGEVWFEKNPQDTEYRTTITTQTIHKFTDKV